MKSPGEAKRETMAREWAVALNSGEMDLAGHNAFEAWLNEDQKNLHAFEKYAAILQTLEGSPELSKADSPPAHVAQHGWWRGAAAAAASLIVVACAAFLFFGTDTPAAKPPPIQTAAAEIRTLTLPDGSVATLGGRSRIETHYEADARRVTLLEGDAYFDVVPDKSRPFYVDAGTRVVRVVGTEFSVSRDSAAVRIAVAEGKVEVFDPELNDVPVEALLPGDKIEILSKKGITRSTVEPASVGRWRQGWLSFRDASLGEIAESIERYSNTRLRFASTDLEETRVTASFGVDDIEQFLAALEGSHDIAWSRADNGDILIRKAG
ncbi:FecR family protein [Henriciella aquimarina]|uniref:FecR family protein n=1 Tax=Henriciella aquimarina TaxID=545261 RepID=UPI000A00785F|nr:FecR domain-containing protein [Henriciella aquimarina]